MSTLSERLFYRLLVRVPTLGPGFINPTLRIRPLGPWAFFARDIDHIFDLILVDYTLDILPVLDDQLIS
jgi:hypothetical protein